MKSMLLIALLLSGWLQPAETNYELNPQPVAGALSGTPQQPGFIPVPGASLAGKLDAAVKQARAANPQARFWTAWAFDVRPGVAVDYEWRGKEGRRVSGEGFNVSFDGKVETRNLAVFLLHEPGGAGPARVEVYNLERQRDYNALPVFWLGRASTDESLSYLRQLVESQQASKKVSEHSVVALALHDDARVSGILKQFVRSLPGKEVRQAAVFWLGQLGGETAYLAELVAAEQEPLELRKQAAFAIGVGPDSGALAALQHLYQTATHRELKKQLIFAVSINRQQEEATNYLIQLATSEREVEVRKQAIFWLGQKAGERSLKVLGDTLNSNDADTEIQKQAVFAISQRPKEEAVPLLLNVAKTHPKAEVRKQAIFWLGQTGDERALTFFKELLVQ
jgi:HEAT repeat protein